MRIAVALLCLTASVSTVLAKPLFQTPRPQTLVVRVGTCGMAPLPPLGCTPVCMCDNRGQNCSWQMNCN